MTSETFDRLTGDIFVVDSLECKSVYDKKPDYKNYVIPTTNKNIFPKFDTSASFPLALGLQATTSGCVDFKYWGRDVLTYRLALKLHSTGLTILGNNLKCRFLEIINSDITNVNIIDIGVNKDWFSDIYILNSNIKLLSIQNNRFDITCSLRIFKSNIEVLDLSNFNFMDYADIMSVLSNIGTLVLQNTENLTERIIKNLLMSNIKSKTPVKLKLGVKERAVFDALLEQNRSLLTNLKWELIET